MIFVSIKTLSLFIFVVPLVSMKSSTNVTKLLGDLGLEEKEAKVYIACLQEQPSTPTTIARSTGLKRATVYIYVDKLCDKGLVVHEVRGTKRTIRAVEPRSGLVHYLREQEQALHEQRETLDSLVSTLTTLTPTSSARTQVSFYEGEEDLKKVLDKILAAKKDVYWLGSMETLLRMESADRLYRHFTLKRLDKGISTYAITDKRILEYPRFARMIGNKRNIRLLSESFVVPGVLVLFGNSVCLITVKTKLNVVVVEDEYMASVVRFLFWSQWICLTRHDG